MDCARCKAGEPEVRQTDHARKIDEGSCAHDIRAARAPTIVACASAMLPAGAAVRGAGGRIPAQPRGAAA